MADDTIPLDFLDDDEVTLSVVEVLQQDGGFGGFDAIALAQIGLAVAHGFRDHRLAVVRVPSIEHPDVLTQALEEVSRHKRNALEATPPRFDEAESWRNVEKRLMQLHADRDS